jgi:tetratricopeptide (TPR) repeat protein
MEHLVGALVGDYRIEALIGHGGMGAVYRAREQRTDRIVALKLIRFDRTSDPRCRIRFLREARLAARLNHTHVIRIYDCGRWGAEQDRYFLAMELVDGASVEDLCRLGIAPRIACGLTHQALGALAHVHARDVIHRDIKPENLLVSRDPDELLRLVVTDFGISAAVGEDPSTRLTEEGTVLGTPAYMAPEHARGLSLSGSGVDLYPMGVILYRLLTGRLPFVGPPVRVLMAKNQQEPTWPDTGPGSRLPAALRDVVLKMMARKPEDRFPFAADARRALRPFAVQPWLSDATWDQLVGVGGADGRTRPFPPVQPTPTPVTGQPSAVARPADGSTEVELELEELARPALWGRDRELDTLAQAASDAERGCGSAVLVRGGVGIGKSALVTSFAEGLAEQGRFVVLRHMSVAASGGITDAIDRWLGTVGRGPDEVAQAAREFLRQNGELDEREVRRTVALLRPGSREATGLVASGPVARERAAYALMIRAFRRIARRRPVALVVEDLHLAGPTAAAFLEHVLFEVAYEPFPFLYLGTWRPGAEQPGFLERVARTDRYEGGVRRLLDLEPLAQGALSAGLVEQRGLDSAVASRLATQAAGNPLFAQVLADGLADGEATDAAAERVRELTELHLERQLAPLPAGPRAQRLMEALALLGDQAELGLLESVLGDDTAGPVDRTVDDLVAAGVLAVREGDGPQALVLTHALHRPVLLERLGRRRERRLHQRAAAELASRAEEGVPLAAGRAAEHLMACGRSADALPLLLRAIDEELDLADVTRAVGHARAALELMSADDPRRGATALRLGRLLTDQGDYQAAVDLLRPVVVRGRPDQAALAIEILTTTPEIRGDRDAWAGLLKTLDVLVGRVGSDGRRARHRARQAFFQATGDLDAALQEAHAAFQGAPSGPEAVRAARLLAWTALLAGDPEVARDAAEVAAREAGEQPDLAADGLRLRAMVQLWTGATQAAEALLEQGLARVRSSGCRERLPTLLLEIGLCSLLEGRPAEARSRFEQADRVARALERPRARAMARYRLLLCDLEQGRLDGLEQRIADLAEETGKVGLVLYRLARGVLDAWVAARRERPDLALRSLGDLESLRGWPATPDAALLAERLADALVRLAGGGRRDVLEASRGLLEIAALHHRRCGNLRRAGELTARLAEVQ